MGHLEQVASQMEEPDETEDNRQKRMVMESFYLEPRSYAIPVTDLSFAIVS